MLSIYTIKVINQAHAGGLLEQDAADIQKTQNSYTAMGVYNNDKMVASFTFGFWTYLFTKRNYRVGGKTAEYPIKLRCPTHIDELATTVS